jgi:hypothetical protein
VEIPISKLADQKVCEEWFKIRRALDETITGDVHLQITHKTKDSSIVVRGKQ